ncbi:hypothetical protein SYNPS1DRAFT_19325, partial [Syncephalis pseudoplumigaleata]
PTVIQLNFVARGRGRAGDAYYLEERHNRCVGCGGDRHLTMHHVVPELYRQHMPLTVKSRSCHDILPLCGHCHDQYERLAMDRKKALALQYGVPLEGKGWIVCREEGAVRRAASALLLHRHRMPEARQEMLAKQVMAWWQKQQQQQPACTSMEHGQPGNTDTIMDIPRRVLEEASMLEQRIKGPDFVEHGAYVVAQLLQHQAVAGQEDGGQTRWPDLEAFIRQWRQHFIDHVRPAHLSAHWHVDASIYTHQANH